MSEVLAESAVCTVCKIRPIGSNQFYCSECEAASSEERYAARKARIKEEIQARAAALPPPTPPLVTINQIITGIVLITAILTFALIKSCGNSDAAKRSVSHDMAIFTAESRVKAMLRDPDSAVFTRESVHGSNAATVCGYVNSKNGFGGMSGPVRFVTSDITVIETDGDTAFDDRWLREC